MNPESGSRIGTKKRAFPFLRLLLLVFFVASLLLLLFQKLRKEQERNADVRIAELPLPKEINQKDSESSDFDTPIPPQVDSFGATPTQDNTGSPTNLANVVAKSETAETETTNLVSTTTNNPKPMTVGWVWIPPGKFIMGSPQTEAGRRSNEGPQTEVTISRGFYLGKYEVTLGQYREMIDARPIQTFPVRGADFNRPFANASWSEAMSFCSALTIREQAAGNLPDGYVCRLPTEAEWEYACRAGTTTSFSFGNIDTSVLLDSFEWYGANSGGSPQLGGSKTPNPWGLFDMHGNVSEWCLDYLGQYPRGDLTDPVGVISGPWFAIKGGNWKVAAEGCRSAFRHQVRFGDKYGHINTGFRVAVAPPVQ